MRIPLERGWSFRAGYRPLTTPLYLRGGEKEIVYDIVLAPLK